MRMVESETRNKHTSSVPSTKRTLRWIGHSRSFQVILIGAGRNPERCVNCRNVPLMLTLFLKLTKIWQRENGKFVDFNDPTQVWRRPSKKRLRISTNDFYCQKLELLTYIYAADNMRIFNGGSSWRGPQMRVGLLTTAIFGDLSGYFFGNFRDRLRLAIVYDNMLPLVGRWLTQNF